MQNSPFQTPILMYPAVLEAFIYIYTLCMQAATAQMHRLIWALQYMYKMYVPKFHVLAYMFNHGKCSKIANSNCLYKSLDKQSIPKSDCFEEAVWSGSFLSAFLTRILRVSALKTKILFDNRKKKCSKF